jgi:hypothetical protein
VVGTCEAPIPNPGFANTHQIDVANVESTGGYLGYMMNDTFVTSIFDGIPTGNNCWRWISCDADYRDLCGSNLNGITGGDPNDPYVIFEICEQELATQTTQPYIYIDEIAIAIY